MGIEQITVEYVRHTGDDLSVVDAARVSYDKKSVALGYTGSSDSNMIPVIHDSDKRLIKYLADHQHYSPFNHAFVTFRCTAPVFCIAQLQKHEYMPWNQVSRRYIDTDPEFYTPDEWRGKPKNSKQGSSGAAESQYFPNIYAKEIHEKCLGDYRKMIAQGVAAEQARMLLPQSMLSSWVWSGSLKAVSKMCKLRCAHDTQYESRVVANKISEYMEELFPVSWAALMGKEYPTIRPMTVEERQRAKERENQ